MIERNGLLQYCLQLTGAYEDFPFGPDVSVLKVEGKMFALIPMDQEPAQISLKCDPAEAIMLREMYQAVTAGYHLNKKHWNTVICDGEVPEPLVLEMIEDSYQLVVSQLSKKVRDRLLGDDQ